MMQYRSPNSIIFLFAFTEDMEKSGIVGYGLRGISAKHSANLCF